MSLENFQIEHLSVDSSILLISIKGVIHLVYTHEGGRGVKQMRTNAYKGGGGVDT